MLNITELLTSFLIAIRTYLSFHVNIFVWIDELRIIVFFGSSNTYESMSPMLQVSGCFEEIPEQVQLLLSEVISRAGNQSAVNIDRAEKNLALAQHYYDAANQHELVMRQQLESLRKTFEIQLLDYGRFEVKANESCKPLTCDVSKYIFPCFFKHALLRIKYNTEELY